VKCSIMNWAPRDRPTGSRPRHCLDPTPVLK
jgi:hypothetical protein